jgi:hypothetical protein
VIAGLALGLLGALAAGCGDDGGGAAAERTTTTAEPAVTTTTEPEDPWAVPEEIDEAYVQRVLQELYRLDGDARRIAVREGIVTEEVIEIVQSMSVDSRVAERIGALQDWSLEGFEGALDPPGDVSLSVLGLERLGVDCVVAEVAQDFTAVSSKGAKNVRSFIVLIRGEKNHTNWLLVSNSVGPEGGPPEDLECE